MTLRSEPLGRTPGQLAREERTEGERYERGKDGAEATQQAKEAWAAKKTLERRVAGKIASFGRDIFAKPAHTSVLEAGAAAIVPLEPKTFLEPNAQVRHGVIVHNEVIAALMQPKYTPSTLATVQSLLDQISAVRIETLPNGLPRAAELGGESRAKETGYDAVWTRDATLIARVWRTTGQPDKAAKAVQALLKYYHRPEQMTRLKSGVNAAAAGDVAWAKSQRPHIKFDGAELKDLSTPWGHAQNDALGHLLSESFAQARAGLVELDDQALAPLVLVASYLKGIDFTTDRDHGQWEEGGKLNGKVNASSLRAVVAGLQQLKRWADADPARPAMLQRVYEAQVGQHAHTFMDFASGASIASMISKGTRSLNELLPLESRGEGVYHRTADLALTTALYLDVTAEPSDQIISAANRQRILESLRGELRRSHGDARYVGDGYWGGYFDVKEPGIVDRLNQVSLEDRAAVTMKEKGEAQWTLGAPILSVIWGKMYQATGRAEYLREQTFELNRALGMVTGERSALGAGTIPESYMQVRATVLDHPEQELWTFHENGLPLNWSKANLRLAMAEMRHSLARAPGGK